MKKTLLFLVMCFWVNNSFAQASPSKQTVTFSLSDFKRSLVNAPLTNGLIRPISLNFPLPSGKTELIEFKETLIGTSKISSITTIEGFSNDKKTQIRLTISDKMTGIFHTPDGYFFIEPLDEKANQYLIYSMSETKAENIECGVLEDFSKKFMIENNKRIASVAPFPVGTQLRKYRMAAAATGEFVTFYGNSQATALARIVDVINAANLIYELEASMTFQLITETTNFSILFTNAATDPFTPDTNFASAAASQAGFTVMNTNGTLSYSKYDVGHTFNVYTNANISSRGQAGPTPCINASKANGWTEWSSGATMPTYLSMVVGVYVHEVGHQFSAWHTYNAIGGTVSSPTFCTGGWDNTSAIEPGSGSTLMSYKNNCVSPTNYTLSGNNGLQYFNTKSLESIFNAINGSSGTCITSTATGNSAPVANAGADITIPKGTPFTLNGTATDANGDAMTYTWEQYDVATANDKGALGTSINGVGGYSAVNSTTAPLFRSEQSSSSTSRTFPKMTYITANANNPADNEGEDLPQVARTMKFRFTVRDNKTGGGGVDSDEIIVTVANSGPLQVSAFNTTQSIAAGSNQTVTWNVNGTNALNANVKILLSGDGGNSFPYVLLASTANDGSESVTIPANVLNTTKGRIKVACTINANAEFFDVNDADITITSTCQPASTIICPSTSLTAQSGSSTLNLGLSANPVTKLVGGSKVYSTAGAGSFPVINNTNNTFTTCQVSSWGSESAVVVVFSVSETGSYTISSTGQDFTAFSIFNSNTYNCGTFVAGNSYGAIGATSSRTITLNACTTYYALLYNINGVNTSITFSLQGSGNIYEIGTNPVGYSYTYTALNTVTGIISAVSSTSNFTSLSGGTYEVYGLMYKNGIVPSNFVGLTINDVVGANCVLLSDNKKLLNVTANPCASSLTLVSPTDNITTGTVTKQASATNGTIIATNTISGAATNATYQAKNIQLNAGFSAANGTIFKAEIGGCN
ncbi:3-coathanger stack domain-containing protein [Emticicia aquatilis]|nr:3-coathanger stack domain-containing protein [Emticicia aquatilis]